MNKIDKHFDKCRDLWCELWEREGRITEAGEKKKVSSVLATLNYYIRENHDALEQWKKPAVSRCRLHLLGEATVAKGQSPRWSAPVISPWKERVATIKRGHLALAGDLGSDPVEPSDKRGIARLRHNGRVMKWPSPAEWQLVAAYHKLARLGILLREADEEEFKDIEAGLDTAIEASAGHQKELAEGGE